MHMLCTQCIAPHSLANNLSLPVNQPFSFLHLLITLTANPVGCVKGLPSSPVSGSSVSGSSRAPPSRVYSTSGWVWSSGWVWTRSTCTSSVGSCVGLGTWRAWTTLSGCLAACSQRAVGAAVPPTGCATNDVRAKLRQGAAGLQHRQAQLAQPCYRSGGMALDAPPRVPPGFTAPAPPLPLALTRPPRAATAKTNRAIDASLRMLRTRL